MEKCLSREHIRDDIMATTETNAVPLPKMKYLTSIDIIAYGLAAFGGYQGFAALHPQTALYALAISAALFAVANKLSSIGD